MDHRLISYLRPLRRRWGLTQAEVAFLIGTRTSGAVARVEAMRTYPPLVHAIAYSILFDTPPEELFPELYGKAYDFLIDRAQELYDSLQGNPSRATRTKLDFLEEVLKRAHPHGRDIPL